MSKWLTRFTVRLVAFAALFLVLPIIIMLGTGLKWPFIVGYDKVTTQTPEKGTTLIREFPQGKSLWDWGQLLIVPIVVAFGTVWFTAQQSKASDAENKDNQRERALQEYIDAISKLLLDNGLRSSKEEDDVRDVARIRTMTILRRLDGGRKGNVLRFLHESSLLEKDKPIILLHGADLRFVDLSFADFSGVDLSGVDLSGANFMGANLGGAVLIGANLSNANLNSASLNDTRLIGVVLRGATMPDGSKHP